MQKSKTYEEFVEKFKPKKTTDDCYTPEGVYDVVLRWAMAHAADPFRAEDVVRPFWPGKDYTAVDYTGKVVVDNPPFSILSKIVCYYLTHGVRFMLFAPAKTLFSIKVPPGAATYVAESARVTYENRAHVPTSFITNLTDTGTFILSDAQLREDIERARKVTPKPMNKYRYPDELVSFGSCNTAQGRVEFAVRADEVLARVTHLHDGSGRDFSVFGGGYVVCPEAAARIAAARIAAARIAAAQVATEMYFYAEDKAKIEGEL